MAKLVDQHLRPGSDMEVNVSDFLRAALTDVVDKKKDQENPELSMKMLLPVREELSMLMTSDTFFRFICDPVCKARCVCLPFPSASTESPSSLDKQSVFEGLSFYRAIHKAEIAPSEWNIIMTGSADVKVDTGETILAQGEVNQYFYRLETGAVRLDRFRK